MKSTIYISAGFICTAITGAATQAPVVAVIAAASAFILGAIYIVRIKE